YLAGWRRGIAGGHRPRIETEETPERKGDGEDCQKLAPLPHRRRPYLLDPRRRPAPRKTRIRRARQGSEKEKRKILNGVASALRPASAARAWRRYPSRRAVSWLWCGRKRSHRPCAALATAVADGRVCSAQCARTLRRFADGLPVVSHHAARSIR